MKGKKVTALILTVLFTISLLTGCSTAELNYLNLQKEIANLNLYGNHGELAIKLTELPASIVSGEADQIQLALIQNMLNSFSITYEGKVDSKNNQAKYNFYLLDKNSAAKTELFTVILKETTLYLKLDRLVSFLKSFGDQNLNDELQSLENVQYLSIDLKDLAKLSSDNPAQLGMMMNSSLLRNAQIQQLLWQKFITGLLTEVYGSFETGWVQAEGNKFTLAVDSADVAKLIQPLLVYSIENIEQLGTYVESFLTGLSSEELAMLGLDQAKVDSFLLDLQQIIPEITTNKADYLAEVAEATGEIEQMFTTMFAGSKITSSLEKKANDTYENTATIVLAICDPDNPQDRFSLALEASNSIAATTAFTVDIPATGVTKLTDLLTSSQQVMQVKVQQSSFTLTKKDGKQSSGPIKVQMLDNSTYLPLRQIAEAFGESVGWEQQTAKAYVERETGKIYLTGTVISGQTYIRIRDFEKLGYTIDWDAATQTVTITK